jgi:hypothetical protein
MLVLRDSDAIPGVILVKLLEDLVKNKMENLNPGI